MTTPILNRLTTGKLYGLDDYSTSPFDVYTANWTLLSGTVAIEAGELSCLASGGVYTAGVKSNATYSGDLVFGGRVTVTAGNLYIQWHTVGSNFYRLYIPSGAGVTAYLYRYPGPATLDSAVTTCTLGVQYEFKIVHNTATGAISVYWGGVLILSGTDTNYTSGLVILYATDPTVNTGHAHYDNIYICTVNTIPCSGLFTGWQLRVNESDTYKAAETGGTATVDCAGLALPVSKVEVLDDLDAVQATFTSTNDVWGGDTYALYWSVGTTLKPAVQATVMVTTAGKVAVYTQPTKAATGKVAIKTQPSRAATLKPALLLPARATLKVALTTRRYTVWTEVPKPVTVWTWQTRKEGS